MTITIVGVDFSGARADKNTWVAQGRLDIEGSLRLESAQSIRREELYRLLAEIATPAVAALDFPFGVPAQFAAHLSAGGLPKDMPDLWQTVTAISADEFIDARDCFVGEHGEPKRAGDQKHHPESYSPLHAVNPNMLPMTYQGIRLLRRWHEGQPRRWYVPPLPFDGDAAFAVTLLELMPGALLRSIGLPFKGYKRGRQSSERRTEILDGLAVKSGIGCLIWIRCAGIVWPTTIAWMPWWPPWARRCGRRTAPAFTIPVRANSPMLNWKGGFTFPAL